MLKLRNVTQMMLINSIRNPISNLTLAKFWKKMSLINPSKRNGIFLNQTAPHKSKGLNQLQNNNNLPLS